MRKLKLTLKKEIISDLEAANVRGGEGEVHLPETVPCKTFGTNCMVTIIEDQCAAFTDGNIASCAIFCDEKR